MPQRLAKADLQLFEASGMLLRIHAGCRERQDRALHLIAVMLQVGKGLLVLIRFQIRASLVDFEAAQLGEYLGSDHGIALQLKVRLILRARLLRSGGETEAGAEGHARHDPKGMAKSTHNWAAEPLF